MLFFRTIQRDFPTHLLTSLLTIKQLVHFLFGFAIQAFLHFENTPYAYHRRDSH